MEQFTLEVEPRDGRGSSEARRLRSSGKIPCVLYHRHETAVAGALDERAFTALARKARTTQVFDIKSPVAGVNGKAALAREIQRNAISGKLLHVDLQMIRDDEEVKIQVPIHISGEAPGVKLDGGILTIIRHSLTVFCLPRSIPESLTADISTLKIGESVHVNQIPVPEGVRIAEELEEPVVSVVAPKAEEVPVAAAPAEGDAAAAATTEGGAPAAAGATPAATDAAAGKAAAQPAKK